jgi:transposase
LSRWRIGREADPAIKPANTGGGVMANTPSFKFFVGIDVSKEKFDVCCVEDSGEKLFRLSTEMKRSGFEELNKKLTKLADSRDSVVIGMESTACYHIPLFSYLTSEGYAVVVINPLLISNYMKLQLRKTKTDKKTPMLSHNILISKEKHIHKAL